MRAEHQITSSGPAPKRRDVLPCRPVLDKTQQKVERLKSGQNEVSTSGAVGQKI